MSATEMGITAAAQAWLDGFNALPPASRQWVFERTIARDWGKLVEIMTPDEIEELEQSLTEPDHD